MNTNSASKFQLGYSFIILFTGISLIIDPYEYFNSFFMNSQANFLNLNIMSHDQNESNRHFGIVVCVFFVFYFMSGFYNNSFFIKMSIFTRIFYGLINIITVYLNLIPQQWLIAAIWDIITALITLKLILYDNKKKLKNN